MAGVCTTQQLHTLWVLVLAAGLRRVQPPSLLLLLWCAVLQAQRAEVDCGCLLDELQQLIQAKADVAQQRADLDRCGMGVSSTAVLQQCAGAC